MSKKVYAGAAGQWNERRNSSKVFPVDPQIMAELRRMLAHARHTRPDWYVWVENKHNGIHDHQAIRSDGSRAACPVWNCDAELEPTAVDVKKQAKRRKLAA